MFINHCQSFVEYIPDWSCLWLARIVGIIEIHYVRGNYYVYTPVSSRHFSRLSLAQWVGVALQHLLQCWCHLQWTGWRSALGEDVGHHELSNLPPPSYQASPRIRNFQVLNILMSSFDQRWWWPTQLFSLPTIAIARRQSTSPQALKKHYMDSTINAL